MKHQNIFSYIIHKINKIEIKLKCLEEEETSIYTKNENYSTNPFLRKLPQTYIWIDSEDKLED